MAAILASFALAWAGTAAIRRHAARLGLVQVPNARSSHHAPTPSGGGSAIAGAGVLAALVLILPLGAPGAVAVLAVLAAATVGLLDDLHELSARFRLLVQAAIIAALLWAVGPEPEGLLARAALPLLFLAGLWWINLFNFMDGIDGIAGSTAGLMLASVCGIALFGSAPIAGEGWWWWGLALSAATLGFLVENWPPARIFMGDAGSYFLGAAIFAFALHSIAAGWVSAPTWLILGAAFSSDATVTLLRRMASGERWTAAHRSHAYQILARRWGSHRAVTVLYGGTLLVFLLPLAIWSEASPALALPLLGAAYAPLMGASFWIGAGRPEIPAAER